TDACDASPTLTFADVTTPGNCPQAKDVTRTWTATDHCGNSSTASQVIHVVDTTAPAITAPPEPTTIQCPANAACTTPTATDDAGELPAEPGRDPDVDGDRPLRQQLDGEPGDSRGGHHGAGGDMSGRYHPARVPERRHLGVVGDRRLRRTGAGDLHPTAGDRL